MKYRAVRQVGEMKENEIRSFFVNRIRIPIRLCSHTLHSPCLCLLLAIEQAIIAMVGECMREP